MTRRSKPPCPARCGRSPLNNLLYASGANVRTVMTGGVVQVQDGRLLVADEAEVAREGGAVAERLWAQLAAEGWFNATPR